MAGSSVTVARASNFKGLAREILISLACVSDDGNGSIPDQDITGLEEWELKEVQNINPGSAQPTTTYKVKIVDADAGAMFLSGDLSITASEKEFTGGHNTLGWYPRIDGTITVKFRNSADSAVANVGNSKTFTVKLRFEKKQGL
jgi:hypothetical protein